MSFPRIRIEVLETGYPLKDLPKDIQTMIRETVAQTADMAYNEMVASAPMRTGAYLASIVKGVRGLVAQVGPTVPYWIYVEKGTRPHMIFPVNASVLHFTVGGQGVFTRYAFHPGTRPNPVVERSWKRALAAVPEIWAKIWERLKR